MKRLVVRAPDWLGDAVMALPAIRSVRRHDVDATLIVVARAGIAPLFRFVREVDEVIAFDGGAAEERAALVAARADEGLLLKNSFGSAWRMYRAGVPQRWGYRTEARGLLLTKGVWRRGGRAARERHQSRYYLDLLSGLGIEPGPLDAHVTVTDAARAAARTILDLARLDRSAPLIGLAPGAAYGGAKRWPSDYVARLVAQLVDVCGASCVLLGSAADRPVGVAIESTLQTAHAWARPSGTAAARPFANLIGHTDLAAMMGVLSMCAAVVSNDSGAMHLAAAVGRPVIALFGPTNEKSTSPLGRHQILLEPVACRPCMLPECPIDHRCMRRVTPERVLAAVRDMMETSG